MDVYDEVPTPLPADLAKRIEAEHAKATIAVKLLLATISLVLFDSDLAAHTADHVYAFLTMDEERRAQFVDIAGAVTLRLENNGDRFERERAAVARPGLDFFRFEWPLYAYSGRRDRIVRGASTMLAAVSPGWSAPALPVATRSGSAQPVATTPATEPEMTLKSLRAWLENPRFDRDRNPDPPAPPARPPDTVPSAGRRAVTRTRHWIDVARERGASMATAMRRGVARAFGGSVQ
jgi:hypothetical protein